jgi:hypothetical protein
MRGFDFSVSVHLNVEAWSRSVVERLKSWGLPDDHLTDKNQPIYRGEYRFKASPQFSTLVLTGTRHIETNRYAVQGYGQRFRSADHTWHVLLPRSLQPACDVSFGLFDNGAEYSLPVDETTEQIRGGYFEVFGLSFGARGLYFAEPYQRLAALNLWDCAEEEARTSKIAASLAGSDFTAASGMRGFSLEHPLASIWIESRGF